MALRQCSSVGRHSFDSWVPVVSLFWSCHFRLWCQRAPCMPSRLDPLGLVQSLVTLLDHTCHKARLTPRIHHRSPGIANQLLARHEWTRSASWHHLCNSSTVPSMGLASLEGGHVPLGYHGSCHLKKVTAWVEPTWLRKDREKTRLLRGWWIGFDLWDAC